MFNNLRSSARAWDQLSISAANVPYVGHAFWTRSILVDVGNFESVVLPPYRLDLEAANVYRY